MCQGGWGRPFDPSQNPKTSNLNQLRSSRCLENVPATPACRSGWHQRRRSGNLPGFERASGVAASLGRMPISAWRGRRDWKVHELER